MYFSPLKTFTLASASFTSHRFDCLSIVNIQLFGNPYDVAAGIPESIDQLVILFDTNHDVCLALTSFAWCRGWLVSFHKHGHFQSISDCLIKSSLRHYVTLDLGSLAPFLHVLIFNRVVFMLKRLFGLVFCKIKWIHYCDLHRISHQIQYPLKK